MTYAVELRTFEVRDDARGRTFPIDVWQPKTTGRPPLIVYSHASLQHRRSATFLCKHLCSHGYVVAAMDHSETVAPELRRPSGETEQQKEARWKAVIDSRVPDIRFLLDWFGARDRAGIVGHSFGGWTALAVPDVEPRIAAIVALAPGGASKARPGILPVKLDFRWGRDIPTLIVAAENDNSIPLEDVKEIFERVPGTKKMMILPRADHMHFVDEIEKLHEGFRTAPVAPELVELQKQMLPMSQLTSAEEAQRLVSEWTLAHFDEFLLHP